MPDKTALVAGATGLVGKELVRLILSHDYYKKVVIISRRALSIDDNRHRLSVILIEDFEKLEDYKDQYNAHHVYCCLGTTLKKAGSKEMFKKIDLEYPIKLAELTMKQPNFESYHVVTSVGSDPDSALFYNQVKGQLEEKLKGMNISALKIYRPSLLMGYRDDFRFLEAAAKAFSSILSFFVIGSKSSRIWSIHGRDVAKSMFIIAKQNRPGVKVFLPKEMKGLARS